MFPQRTNGLAWPHPHCVQISTVILLSRTTHEGRAFQQSPIPKRRSFKIIIILAYASRCPQVSLSLTPRDGGSQGVLSRRWQKYKESEQKHSELPRASAWDGALHHSRPVPRTRQSPWPGLQGADHSHRAKGTGVRNKHVTYTHACLFQAALKRTLV